MKKPEAVRINLYLSQRERMLLVSLAKAHDKSMSEIVRAALHMLMALELKPDEKLIVRHKNGNEETIRFIW